MILPPPSPLSDVESDAGESAGVEELEKPQERKVEHLGLGQIQGERQSVLRGEGFGGEPVATGARAEMCAVHGAHHSEKSHECQHGLVERIDLMDAYVFKGNLYCAHHAGIIRDDIERRGGAPDCPEDLSDFDADEYPLPAVSRAHDNRPRFCVACGTFIGFLGMVRT